jgi:hypothetical protein
MILMSLFVTLLHKTTNSSDIVVGSPYAGKYLLCVCLNLSLLPYISVYADVYRSNKA